MAEMKIKSWDALKKMREDINEENKKASAQTVIAVGMGTCGAAAGANEVLEVIKDELNKCELDNVVLISTGCYGICYAEPIVEVRLPGAPGVKYGYVNDETARKIVQEHVIKGELLDRAIVGQEVQKP